MQYPPRLRNTTYDYATPSASVVLSNEHFPRWEMMLKDIIKSIYSSIIMCSFQIALIEACNKQLQFNFLLYRIEST